MKVKAPRPLQHQLATKIGPLYLTACAKGLTGVFWNKQPGPLTKSLKNAGTAGKILARAAAQLKEYCAGKRTRFSLPLLLEGTAFQKKVWRELLKIPHGKTCSYQDIARRIKNPKAVRAVGSANGKNPVCVIIPCHRVIAADGSLGGYSSGLRIKTKLLKLERE